MKLNTRCQNCKSDIYFRKRASDRFVLARKMGKKIDLKCTSCGFSKSYHVNDIDAEESRTIKYTALAILILGTIGAFMYILPYLKGLANVYVASGLIGLVTVPFLIYQGINSTHSDNVRYFNRKLYG